MGASPRVHLKIYYYLKTNINIFMGSVVPLKKSANSAYLELKNLLSDKLRKVENLIQEKLKSDVNLIEKMSNHHLRSGGKRLRALINFRVS